MEGHARTALVTGGARGIGRACALRLHADGCAVSVCDLDEDGAVGVAQLIEGEGGRAIGLRADVASKTGVDDCVARTEESLGPVDILVNNAGWDELMPFVQTDEAFWDRIIEINYKGVLRTTAATLPGMLQRGWGRIVNISSEAGRVGSTNAAVYAGAKAGVIGFTKTIAREAATRGVTANAVCPGPTETPLLEEIISKTDDAAMLIQKMSAVVPMARLGQPEDIAAAVAFIAREDAGFITGQTLSVSGGFTMA